MQTIGVGMERLTFLKGDYLSELKAELINLDPIYEEKLQDAQDNHTLDWEMCSRGLFSEADLLDVYSRVTGLSLCDDEDIDEVTIFSNISLIFLLTQCVLPIHWDESTIEIVICDPYNIEALIYLFKEMHGKEVTFKLAKRSTIEHTINTVYKGDAEDELDSFVDNDSEEALRSMASEAKIVRLVNEMFARAAELNASDIHVEPEENRMAIRFRIDGMLQEILVTPINDFSAVASRIKLLGGLNIAEHRLPQDGRTTLKIGRSEMDVRINTLPTIHGESIVLRILRKDTRKTDLASVGMNKELINKFSAVVESPHGIILVVGPTGSGKTTTLYTVMETLNTRDKKIITIEDPVEYQMNGLSQVQVNHKIGLDFASGLRNIVRQDPDVILVGEIRDKETAEIAINAALTGHLVLSTLHTNDAAGAVSRLQDMGIEGFLISSSLVGVLSQRLVRTICWSCRGDGILDDCKCKKCHGSGMYGRTGIFELLIVNEELRQAVNNNLDSSAIGDIACRNGMVLMADYGNQLVEFGSIKKDALFRAVTAQ